VLDYIEEETYNPQRDQNNYEHRVLENTAPSLMEISQYGELERLPWIRRLFAMRRADVLVMALPGKQADSVRFLCRATPEALPGRGHSVAVGRGT